MNGSPEVTVILPTYNWAEVLPYAIGSVLQQTLRDFELLVVGDGCTDNSESVVRAVGDHRVRWINLPANTGHQAGPNNEGLRLSRGRFVAYIGHDDLWLPRHLELMTAAINESTAFARGRALFVPPGAPPDLRPGAGWNYWRGAWIPPTSLVHVRDATCAVGGWRFPADAGTLDPEADLCARIFDVYGPPALVPHLTGVKFPASLRPDVYRTRPYHEQQEWSLRIHAADDPEQTLLARFQELVGPRRRAIRRCRRLARPLRRALLGRLQRRPDTTTTALERHNERRDFRGLSG